MEENFRRPVPPPPPPRPNIPKPPFSPAQPQPVEQKGFEQPNLVTKDTSPNMEEKTKSGRETLRLTLLICGAVVSFALVITFACLLF